MRTNPKYPLPLVLEIAPTSFAVIDLFLLFVYLQLVFVLYKMTVVWSNFLF